MRGWFFGTRLMSPRCVLPSSPRRVYMRVRLTAMAAGHGNIPAVQGRWTGKPVRNRRGPATVTGDTPRTWAAATGVWPPPLGRSTRTGKARGRSPGARRPPADHRHEYGPRGKGVGSAHEAH